MTKVALFTQPSCMGATELRGGLRTWPDALDSPEEARWLDVKINYKYFEATGKIRGESRTLGCHFFYSPLDITKELRNWLKLCLPGRCRELGVQPYLLLDFLSLWLILVKAQVLALGNGLGRTRLSGLFPTDFTCSPAWVLDLVSLVWLATKPERWPQPWMEAGDRGSTATGAEELSTSAKFFNLLSASLGPDPNLLCALGKSFSLSGHHQFSSYVTWEDRAR